MLCYYSRKTIANVRQTDQNSTKEVAITTFQYYYWLETILSLLSLVLLFFSETEMATSRNFEVKGNYVSPVHRNSRKKINEATQDYCLNNAPIPLHTFTSLNRLPMGFQAPLIIGAL